MAKAAHPVLDGAEEIALHVAELARAKTALALDLAWEAANYRGFVCPEHGDVGKNVNGDGLCRENTARTRLEPFDACGLECERKGDLLTPVRELVANARFLADAGVVTAIVEARMGLKRNSKVENHVTFQQINLTVEELEALPPPTRARLIKEQLVLVKEPGALPTAGAA